MTPTQVVLAVLVPGAFSAVALLVLSFLGVADRDESAPDAPARRDGWVRRALPALVGVGAFFFADLGLNQWHELWPKDGTQRFLAIAIAAGAAGVVHALVGLIAVTVVLRLALGAGLALGVLLPLPEMYMPRGLLVVLTVGSGVWLAGTGAALDAVGSRVPRAATALGAGVHGDAGGAGAVSERVCRRGAAGRRAGGDRGRGVSGRGGAAGPGGDAVWAAHGLAGGVRGGGAGDVRLSGCAGVAGVAGDGGGASGRFGGRWRSGTAWCGWRWQGSRRR
ncbi:MAG: hypothetical protein HND58_11880 [Planctomycetota bacterium]|nr:MAG: hypothetical protein HND58_11880 [Planctomycetota bacterium]